MKFLYDDPRMHALLRIWAGELPLVVVGHFFWNSGDILQMSQKGLLRVLLYEALRKHPKLIPIVLHRHAISDISANSQSWSLSKLRQVFDNLATQQIVQVKLCFFIDGLDEYDGNYAELVEIFKRHAESPNVKFCLSSRPLVVFDDCLSGYPSLRLQDLTREDIRVFVSERLGKDQRMLAMTLEEPGKVAKLISDIVDKADGVFLWVDLVVTSLLSGLQDHNQLSDLQNRVDVLPSKLEDLYEHMLNFIDPYYHPESSRIFQLFRAAGNNIEVIDLYLANQEDINFALKSSIEPKSAEEIGRMSREMEALLETRCAGLLEFYDASHAHSQCSPLKTEDRVVYIHRTARDFLEQPRIWSKVETWSGKSICDPWVLLLAGRVLRLKFITSNMEDKFGDVQLVQGSIDPRPWPVIRDALSFASHRLDEMLTFRISLLDEMDRTMLIHWATWVKKERTVDSWPDKIFESPLMTYDHQSSMLSLAVQAGLIDYVRDKTEHDLDLIKKKPGRPLLDYTLSCESVCELASEEMVAYLLTHGASPNQRFNPGNRTPWENALLLFSERLVSLRSTRFEIRPNQFEGFLLKWVRIYTLLVQHGADPNAYCQIPKGYSTRNYYSALEIFQTELKGWKVTIFADRRGLFREDEIPIQERNEFRRI